MMTRHVAFHFVMVYLNFQLRNVLLDCLNRLLTSGDDDLDYVEPSFDDPDEQAFVAKDIPNDSVLPSAHDLISTAKRKGIFHQILKETLITTHYLLSYLVYQCIQFQDGKQKGTTFVKSVVCGWVHFLTLR